MKRALALIAFVFMMLTGFTAWKFYIPAAAAPHHGQSDCQPFTFEKKQFTECLAVPGKHQISTRITGSSGIIYRGFASLSRDIDSRNIAFAVNGGMFDTTSKPIGYYAEAGQRLHPMNDKSGSGNFYLKPNGVFFGDSTGNWQVMTSADFETKITRRPMFGTQSGPMLLTAGMLANGISPNGTSLNIRNAVGVDATGRAHFIISDEPVSFGTMARAMRDHAQVFDALYLDGTVSALWNPSVGRMDERYPLGPLIVVTTIRKGL